MAVPLSIHIGGITTENTEKIDLSHKTAMPQVSLHAGPDPHDQAPMSSV